MIHSYCKKCGNTIIRPLAENDIESLRRMRNESTPAFLQSRAVITVEQQQEWYREQLETKDSMTWTIEEEGHPSVVGSVSLFHITNTSAEFGRFMITEQVSGRGIGRNVLEAVILVAFQDLKLDRIYLHCDKENVVAVHIYKTAGFCVKKEQTRQGDITEYVMEYKKPKMERV